uniref:Uncharacterized protein n=1 Tax=Setaria italica TaxID=4555 RepID=K3Y485_SETIT
MLVIKLPLLITSNCKEVNSMGTTLKHVAP